MVSCWVSVHKMVNLKREGSRRKGGEGKWQPRREGTRKWSVFASHLLQIILQQKAARRRRRRGGSHKNLLCLKMRCTGVEALCSCCSFVVLRALVSPDRHLLRKGLERLVCEPGRFFCSLMTLRPCPAMAGQLLARRVMLQWYQNSFHIGV